MTCPQNAVPHVLARPFVGFGDSDPDQGFDSGNDFVANNPNFAVFNICDNTTLIKCIPCGAEPQAFHAFSAFRVFENTNAPFQPRVEPYIVDIIKCSDFAGFTPALAQYTNANQILAELCTYASTNSLPSFVVKLVGNNGHSVPIFNVPAGCTAIPNVPLTDQIFYTVFVNGLACKFISITADPNIFNAALCLNNFNYSSISSINSFAQIATLICSSLQAGCPPVGPDFEIVLIFGVFPLLSLLSFTGGVCVPTGNLGLFVAGTYTITIGAGGPVFKIFTTI
jgi:hypothetical protein